MGERKYNYHGMYFRSIHNSASGEVSGETIFLYRQKEHVLWATYKGGDILFGTMTGIVDNEGVITFVYQHVNRKDAIKTGRCTSRPFLSDEGILRLHESWQWTVEDEAKGESIVEQFLPEKGSTELI